MISRMAKVIKFWRMEPSTLVTSRMVKSMDMEFIRGLIHPIIKETGRIITSLAMESMFGPMVENIMAHGKII